MGDTGFYRRRFRIRIVRSLNGTVEFFRKASRDLLFNVSQPLSSGVEKIVQNIGKVRNQGVEIDLNYQVLNQKIGNYQSAQTLHSSIIR